MLDKIGGNLYPSVVMHLAQEIMKNGGTIAKGKKLTASATMHRVVEDVRTGKETHSCGCCDPGDGRALRKTGLRSFPGKAYGDNLILVGDSSKPGQIYDALHSGHDRAFVY